MTVPIIRQRVKHRKTRTGCRTCRQRRVKCDEARPICQNCIRSSKECAGYELPAPAQATTQAAALLPRGNAGLTTLCRKPRTTAFEMTSLESTSFDFFRRFTVYELPGSTHLLRWDQLVHKASIEEIAVTHAVIALAAMHRGPEQYTFALSQYNKAVSHLRRYIENLSEGSSVEIVLLLSLLFFSFDCLQGSDISATKHWSTGLRILCHQNGIVIDDHTERPIKVRIEPRNTMELLTQTFVRLDSDVLLAEDCEPWLQPVIDEPIPKIFESLEQTLVHLDALAGEASTVLGWICREAENSLPNKWNLDLLDEDAETTLLGVEMHIMPLDHRPDLLARLENIRQDMSNWMMAHAMYRPTPEEEPLHILANVNFFFWWVQISHVRSTSEMHYDGWLTQFEYITSLIERYIDLAEQRRPSPVDSFGPRPALAIGTNMPMCLHDIATRCRSMSVRRRCIAALRRLNMAGTCDGHWLAAYVQHVTDWEERTARAITGDYTTIDLLPGNYPEAARVLESEGFEDLGDGVKHEDVYKLDLGKIVWAHSPLGYAGEIQLDYDFFRIDRGLQGTMVLPGMDLIQWSPETICNSDSSCTLPSSSVSPPAYAEPETSLGDSSSQHAPSGSINAAAPLPVATDRNPVLLPDSAIAGEDMKSRSPDD